MVEYRTGYFYQMDIDIIVNNVSYLGRLAKGYPLKFRRDFKDLKKQYHDLCKDRWFSDTLLGTVQIIEAQKYARETLNHLGKKWLVANMFTQHPIDNDGNLATDYWSLKRCLLYLKTVCTATLFATKNNMWTLAIPYKMGCDDDEGSWQVVKSIIDDIFQDDPNIKVLIMVGGSNTCEVKG